MNSRRSQNVVSVLVPALSCLLFSSCGGGLPSKVDHLPADLANTELKAKGIYEDAWVGDAASLDLRQPGGRQVAVLRGTIPNVGNPGFRSNVELRLDDRPIGHWKIGIGDFAISAPMPTGAGKRRVTVLFSNLQPLPGGDRREVGARLSFMGFEPESAAREGPSDIVRTANLQLGGGWGVLETFRKETFRWVDNNAEFELTAEQSGSFVLSLLVEPGPGVDGKPFLLKVLDASGRQVSAEPVLRRGTVNFILPVQSGEPNRFRLHLDGGGKPARNDPRILNFRVFELESGVWKAPK